MECKRDGLASIGEALSSLDGPGKKNPPDFSPVAAPLHPGRPGERN